MKLRFLLLAAVLLLLQSTPVLAQSGGDYTLSWWTVDTGGAVSSGGIFTLSGTIGQPEAGARTTGTLTLGEGYWGGGVRSGTINFRLYLPLVLKDA